jgi:hypothetical protein
MNCCLIRKGAILYFSILLHCIVQRPHTAELLVPVPRTFEVETATANLRKYKFTSSHQIPAELVIVGGTLRVSPQLILGCRWYALILTRSVNTQLAYAELEAELSMLLVGG